MKRLFIYKKWGGESMFQFVKKLFNKDGQLVDYYIDMMAEKNRLSQLAL